MTDKAAAIAPFHLPECPHSGTVLTLLRMQALHMLSSYGARCVLMSASPSCAAVPLRRALSSSLSVKFEEPEDVVAKREAQSRPMSGMSSPGGAPSPSPPLSRAATPPVKGLSQVVLWFRP